MFRLFTVGIGCYYYFVFVSLPTYSYLYDQYIKIIIYIILKKLMIVNFYKYIIYVSNRMRSKSTISQSNRRLMNLSILTFSRLIMNAFLSETNFMMNIGIRSRITIHILYFS